MFQEAKTVKTGTKFVIRDTAQCMGVHTEKHLKQFRCGRRSHWRVQVSEWGECSKSKPRQRYTWREITGVTLMRRRAVKSDDVSHLHRTFLQVFVYLCLIILFLTSHLTGSWTLPHKVVRNSFLRWIPPQKPMSTYPYWWGPFPFYPPENFLRMQTGKSSWTLGVGTLPLL